MEPQDIYLQNDEINLKELILKAKEFILEIRKKWWLLALSILLFCSFFIYKFYSTPVVYKAKLTFMVDANESGGFGGVSGLLAQFGIGGGRGRSNLDKILAISKSKRIINEVLLLKSQVDGKEDYFANHLIYIKDLRERWKDSEIEGLAEYRFESSDLLLNDKLRDRILNSLHKMIAGDGDSKNKLFTSNYSEESGIMNMSMETTSEDFSSNFIDSLYDHLSAFYIDKSTKKASRTYKVFKHKTDSIYSALLQKQYALANVRDLDKASYLRGSRLKRDRLVGEVEILTRSYAESFKNTEIASIDLELKTPFITSIDRPIRPLKKQKPSIVYNLLVGILLGSAVGVGLIVLRKIYKDALAN